MNIGAKIKNLRLKNGLTQEELADRCELSKGFISLVEHNQTSPSITTLGDILDALGTDFAKFFKEDIPERVVFGKKDFSIKTDEGEEFGYVLEGTVTVVIGEEEYPAKKGESFYFIANKPHMLENRGAKQAKVIWISAPPSF